MPDIPLLKTRAKDSHKGEFGRVLIVGGSKGMIGAPALAGMAALRSGAGLVTIASPECIQLSVAGLVPCATSIGLKDNGVNISSAGVSELTDKAVGERLFDVIAVGPGLGRVEAIVDFIEMCLSEGIPVVVDADGLNMLAESDWQGRLGGRCIITPHPGELARLMHCTSSQIQADRKGYAMECALCMGRKGEGKEGKESYKDGGNSVCVLKGYRTIVTDGQKVYVNETGNPGMATGGSGDVLTGVISALLGQGYSCFDSAVLGVYVHGLAGDLACDKLGEISLTARDLVDFLPEAFIKTRALSDRENRH